MTDMDPGIADNVTKGKGIVKKEDFRVVGMNKKDRQHYEFTGEDPDARGRGRPSKDETWRVVGKKSEE